MGHGKRRRDEPGRRVRRAAAKETAEDVVASEVALRVGQVIWYVAAQPFRLLAKAFDALT